MLYLALAVACSLAIAMIFKLSERRGLNRISLLTVNYAVAFGLAGVLLAAGFDAVGEGLALSPGLLALGVWTGALFIGGFVLFSYAILLAGMSLATGVMRLAVALPFMASWLVWGEVPSGPQLAGLAVAGVAFFLIARRGDQPAAELPVGSGEPAAWQVAGVLALLFLAGGAVDVSMKAFDELFAATSSRSLFLLMVFGVAFGIGLGWVVWRGLRSGQWVRRGEVGLGVLLGLVNYGSAEFILQAIARIPGTFVFPANNIAIVVGAAVLGVVVWGERLSGPNKVGLGLAAGALLLLGL
jgi:drug/metabolite transporter (DMT)-like permease